MRREKYEQTGEAPGVRGGGGGGGGGGGVGGGGGRLGRLVVQ